MGDWQDWIGRTHVQSDILTPALVLRHRATLDLTPHDPAPLPGIHWLLNPPEAATADLGHDGHPCRAGEEHRYRPLIYLHLPNRMWASSDVEFLGDIAVGATVTRTSTIADITEKWGSSGKLTFVMYDHVVEADGVVAVRERQTLVYKEEFRTGGIDQGPNAAKRASVSDPGSYPGDVSAGWPHHHTLTPSETLLFRFSALTFNTHRIHYDLPYARDVEGYKALVVHGPLTATLLLNWATELFGPIRRFAFRAVSPAFVGEILTLVARQDSDSFTLAALGPTGTECIKASASI